MRRMGQVHLIAPYCTLFEKEFCNPLIINVNILSQFTVVKSQSKVSDARRCFDGAKVRCGARGKCSSLLTIALHSRRKSQSADYQCQYFVAVHHCEEPEQSIRRTTLL
jgi:hypothetical protein